MVFVPFTASMYSILAIAVERYLFIKYCFEYSNIVTTRRTLRVIIAVWCIALLHAIFIAMPWTYPSASGRVYCTCMIVEASSDLYIILYTILCNIGPILLINVLYFRIMIVAHGANKRNVVPKLDQKSSDYTPSARFQKRSVTTETIQNAAKTVDQEAGDISITYGKDLNGEPRKLSKKSISRLRTNFRLKNIWWKQKGIPTLTALIISVTLLWFPLSCGMLVFSSQHDVRYTNITLHLIRLLQQMYF
jgi:hypothetical protein